MKVKYVAGAVFLGTVAVGAYLLLRKDSDGLPPDTGLKRVLEKLKEGLPRLPEFPRIPVPAPVAPVPAAFWWFWRKRKK